MKVDITGRNVEVTAALREFAAEKLQKLGKLLEEPIEVHIVLSINKHRHVVEVQVKSRTVSLAGADETGDLYASLGQVVEKLERQALKHKEKVTDHHRGKAEAAGSEAADAEAERGGAPTRGSAF